MSAPRSTEHRHGFTIFELAIALALITFISVIAIPAYYAQPSVTLDNASQLLASDLRYAQNHAMLKGEATQITFHEAGDGYAVERGTAAPLPNPVGGGDLVRVYSRDAIFEGVVITAVRGVDEPRVSFDEDGVSLQRAAIEVHYEDEVRILHLAEGVGAVEIEGLARSWGERRN